MSNVQKEWLSKWLPLVVAVGTNLVLVAYSYGRLEQRMAPVEEYVKLNTHERATLNFVPRKEFEIIANQHVRDMDELKEQNKDIIKRLDSLKDHLIKE